MRPLRPLLAALPLAGLALLLLGATEDAVPEPADGKSGRDIYACVLENRFSAYVQEAKLVSGDRGDDTMVGGDGADSFHSSNEAGIDRVLDFSVAQGDRVQLDPGTTFSVSQVGADTVISLTGGQVILVGVSMSGLLPTSIFGA